MIGGGDTCTESDLCCWFGCPKHLSIRKTTLRFCIVYLRCIHGLGRYWKAKIQPRECHTQAFARKTRTLHISSGFMPTICSKSRPSYSDVCQFLFTTHSR